MSDLKSVLNSLVILFSLWLIAAASAQAATVTECTGHGQDLVELPNTTFHAADNVNCEAFQRIEAGPSLTLEPDASLSLYAPTVSFTAPVRIQGGARFTTATTPQTARIVFVGDQSAVFDAVGQQATFEAVVLDRFGGEVPGAELSWSLASSSSVELVSSDGRTATVRATAATVGDTPLNVSYPAYGLEDQAQVLIAKLAPDASYFASDQVLGREPPAQAGGAEVVTLPRTSETEAIQVGEIFLSGDAAGVLIRVTVVEITADRVILTGQPAAFTEAFEDLSITDAQSAPLRMWVEYDFASGRMTVRGPDGTVQQRSLLDGIECKNSSGTDVGLAITGGSIRLSAVIGIGGGLVMEDFVVEHFALNAWESIDAAATSGILVFSSTVGAGTTCRLDVGSYESPGLQMSVLNFKFQVNAAVGVDASATFNGPSFSVAGPSASIGGSAQAGICYSEADGWTNCSQAPSLTASVQPVTANFTPGVDFEITAAPYGLLDMDLEVDLGRSFLSFNLVQVKFAELKDAVPLNFRFTAPFDPLHRDYVGPEWSITNEITGSWHAELSGGGLLPLTEKLGLGVSAGVTGNLFEPISTPLLSSPKPDMAVTMDCDLTCQVNPEDEDEVTMDLTAGTSSAGTAQFLLSKDESETLTEHASASLSGGAASTTWAPSLSDLGKYEAYPRIAIDTLSNSYPYASSEGRGFYVGTRFTKLDENGDELPQDAAAWSCVRDNQEGLVWESKTDDGGLRDRDWRYAWYDPDPATNGGFAGCLHPDFHPAQNRYCLNPSADDFCPQENCNSYDYAAAMNASGYCNSDSWRVPTYQELEELLIYELVFHNHPPDREFGIDLDLFPFTSGEAPYQTTKTAWSDNTMLSPIDFLPEWDAGDGFWYLDFRSLYKNEGGHLRLVRDAQ